ncbi:anti-phage protein KwaA [Sulfurovum sp.]|uniref:anti-phage protein KwaA n=1 Tax=Sulfurovum sp. TaxID=1969726 RepID=UPI00356682B2
MNNTRRKIDLYLMSLGLLFIFFIIITVDFPICIGKECTFIGFVELLKNNILPVISIVLLLYCFYAFKRFEFDLEGSTDLPFKITRIKGINYEHLTFLATYVVPLISFDFDSYRQMIVLSLLLIVMGIIYIKTDLFYANPSLALLGFQIYEANGNFKMSDKENIILICRGRLIEGQKVHYIKLDERIYYVKKDYT